MLLECLVMKPCELNLVNLDDRIFGLSIVRSTSLGLGREVIRQLEDLVYGYANSADVITAGPVNVI